MKRKGWIKTFSVMLAAAIAGGTLTGCAGVNNSHTNSESAESAISADSGNTSGKTGASAHSDQTILPESTDITSLGSNDPNYEPSASDVSIGLEKVDDPEIYSNRMFWGRWILKRESGQPDFSTTDLDMGDYTVNIESFPAGMVLGTESDSGIGGDTMDEYSFSRGTYGVIGFQKGEEKEAKNEEDVTEQAMADLNGIAKIGGPQGDLSYDCVYDVQGNTLALGLVDNIYGKGVGNKVKIQKELDYTIDWKGPYLTLTKGDEKATYVPEKFDTEDHDQVIIKYADLISPLSDDSIVHLAIGTDNDYIETKYSPAAKTDFQIDNDGNMSIKDGLGTQYNCKGYYYSGSTLTLDVNNEISMFRIDNDIFRDLGTGYQLLPDSLKIGGEDAVNLRLGDSVETMLQSGFSTTENVSEMIPSLQIAKFDVSYSGCVLHVKALNRYEKAAPLSACTVAGVYADKDSGDVSYQGIFSGGSQQAGVSDYMDVKDSYTNIYQATAKEIVIKGAGVYKISSVDEFGIGVDPPYGEALVDTANETEVIFLFTHDVLDEIGFEMPEYLYGALDENVKRDELVKMTQDQVSHAIELRESFLTKLQNAFQNAGVDVDVDPETGVIRMSNDILFDTDQYKVKEAGKDYITQIMNTVASVVLDKDMRDLINKVEIAGHTDVTGPADYNYVLSVQRAKAVWECYKDSSANTLSADQKKQFERLIDVKGYSFNDPILDEQGNPINEKSRRVEVRFFINTNATVQDTHDSGSDSMTGNIAPESAEEIEKETDVVPSTTPSSVGDFTFGQLEAGVYVNSTLGIRMQIPSGWNGTLGDPSTMEDAISTDDYYDDFSLISEDTAQQVEVYAKDHGGTVTDAEIDDIVKGGSLKELVDSYNNDDSYSSVSEVRNTYTIAGKRFEGIAISGNLTVDGGSQIPFWHVYCMGAAGHYVTEITFASYGEDYTENLMNMISAA